MTILACETSLRRDSPSITVIRQVPASWSVRESIQTPSLTRRRSMKPAALAETFMTPRKSRATNSRDQAPASSMLRPALMALPSRLISARA